VLAKEQIEGRSFNASCRIKYRYTAKDVLCVRLRTTGSVPVNSHRLLLVFAKDAKGDYPMTAYYMQVLNKGSNASQLNDLNPCPCYSLQK
jgi:hypothetical protein